MTKTEIVSRLEKLKGVRMTYFSEPWTLKNYSIDEEQVSIETEQGGNFKRSYNGIVEFLKLLVPAPNAPIKQANKNTELESDSRPSEIVKSNSDAPKTFNDLRDILMNNIENLRTGKIKVDVAKEICNHAQVVVNITKLEIDIAKHLNKK